MLAYVPAAPRTRALRQFAGHQSKIRRDENGRVRTRAQQVKEATGKGWRPDNVREDERLLLNDARPAGRRCVYCEDNDGNLFDHLLPRAFYPGLTYEWSNLIRACSTCNEGGIKGSKAAVLDAGQPEGWRQLIAEDHQTAPPRGRSAWLNPRSRDPLWHFMLDIRGGTFLLNLRHPPGTANYAKAHWTRETLQLNREPLRQARENAYFNFMGWLEKVAAALAAQTDTTVLKTWLRTSDHPTVWAEMKRQRAHLRAVNDLITQVPEVLNW